MKVLQCSIFKITEKLYTQFFQFCVLLHKRYSDVSNKRGGGNRRGVHAGQFSITGGC